MSDRSDQIEAFLDRAGWSGVRKDTLAGDLSVRRYIRLRRTDGQTAVLMDAPPACDPSTPAFVRITDWLHGAGLSAPRIFAKDTGNGLLLLEDFGDTKINASGNADPAVYDALVDLLILLRVQRPPALSQPGAGEFVRMTELADTYYPGVDRSRLAPFRQTLEATLRDLLTDPLSVSLRDFHADNLMWLPDRAGLTRFGLLDYQDAFLTHPVYDLVSLLTDARMDVPAPMRHELIDTYADRAEDDPVRLRAAFAAFSAQRNLRILGIFARAARDFGKRHHLDKLPRVHGYLMEALDHPVFSNVAADAKSAIPAPTPELIELLS